jgi:AraC-like DNA-binding protein
VLGPPELRALRRTLERLAALIALDAPLRGLRYEAESLNEELGATRLTERGWEAARQIVDERMTHAWSMPQRRLQLNALGLARRPERLLAALFVSQRRDSDRVDELLRRRAFQRTVAELAQKTPNVLAGRIGDYGITLLSARAGSAVRIRRELSDLGEQAASMARRRFGLSLHLGAGSDAAPLPTQYQEALAAAESALAADVLRLSSDEKSRPALRLGQFGVELARLLKERPSAVPARFDVFLETAAARSGYRAELARAYIEAGFERMTEGLVESGALEQRGLETLRGEIERSTREVRTLAELFVAYRRAAEDLVSAVTRPSAALHERSLRRAEEYLRQHYGEDVTLERVAAVAGFAPSYFSRLFHETHGMTFVAYLTRLRLERAKQLLARSELALERVAELSGFSSRHYLSRVFKRTTGMTLLGYRKKIQRHRPPPEREPEQ